MEMTTKDYITLSIAVVGATLGIINIVRAFWRDRVNIKIKPSMYVMPTSMPEPKFGLCVEVVNMGFVPVTISNRYFEKKDKGIFADLHIKSTHGDQRLPVRLDSREATTLLFDSAIVFDGALDCLLYTSPSPRD